MAQAEKGSVDWGRARYVDLVTEEGNLQHGFVEHLKGLAGEGVSTFAPRGSLLGPFFVISRPEGAQLNFTEYAITFSGSLPVPSLQPVSQYDENGKRIPDDSGLRPNFGERKR